MKEVFVVYKKEDGVVIGSGVVDRKQKPDGSTVYERIKEISKYNPELGIRYFKNILLPIAERYIIKNKQLVDLWEGEED